MDCVDLQSRWCPHYKICRGWCCRDRRCDCEDREEDVGELHIENIVDAERYGSYFEYAGSDGEL